MPLTWRIRIFLATHEHNNPEIMSAWDFMARFPADKDARAHIERMRWGDKPFCPHCGSLRTSRVVNEKPQPYRCKDCRKHFSVTTGTVFHSTNLSPRKCLYAIYLMVVAKKSISSCQMARELGCTQKTAWYLAQRIRETWLNKSGVGVLIGNPPRTRARGGLVLLLVLILLAFKFFNSQFNTTSLCREDMGKAFRPYFLEI